MDWKTQIKSAIGPAADDGVLEELRPKVEHINQLLADRMTSEEARQLSELLEKIYERD